MNEKVTIVVPIYNVEKYVEKCLISLINQTYTNIEILAIIDGSEDGSIDIVKKYEKLDSRVICIEKENGGYGSVLQYAIKTIKTKYFMICDPDDWLAENAVQDLIETAETYNVDLVVADKYLVYTNNYEEKYCSSVKEDFEITPGVLLTDNKVFDMAFLEVSPHSKLYKTELVKDLIFPLRVNYTDFLLYIYALTNVKTGIYINKALSYYLIDREGNSATDKSVKAIKNQITVYYEIIKHLKSNLHTKLLFRMYVQLRYPILNIASKLTKADYKVIKKEIIKLFETINFQKYMLKYIKSKNKIKELFNKIIYCGFSFSFSRGCTIDFVVFLNKIRRFGRKI